MNPLFRIDFSISDSLKIVRKSVLIYETIIQFRKVCSDMPSSFDIFVMDSLLGGSILLRSASFNSLL